VRSAADGGDFTSGSILLAGLPAYLLDTFCRTDEEEKPSNSCHLLPVQLDPWVSLHLQMCKEASAPQAGVSVAIS